MLRNVYEKFCEILRRTSEKSLVFLKKILRMFLEKTQLFLKNYSKNVFRKKVNSERNKFLKF